MPTLDRFPDLVPLLRHESGHFVECSDGKLTNRLSENPRFRQCIQDDLDQACRNGALPIRKTADGYELTEAGKSHIIKQLHDGTFQPTQHAFYYLPKQVNDIKGYDEAFAEIFAALNGQGTYPDPGFITRTMYPSASRYVKDHAVPGYCGYDMAA